MICVILGSRSAAASACEVEARAAPGAWGRGCVQGCFLVQRLALFGGVRCAAGRSRRRGGGRRRRTAARCRVAGPVRQCAAARGTVNHLTSLQAAWRASAGPGAGGAASAGTQSAVITSSSAATRAAAAVRGASTGPRPGNQVVGRIAQTFCASDAMWTRALASRPGVATPGASVHGRVGRYRVIPKQWFNASTCGRGLGLPLRQCAGSRCGESRAACGAMSAISALQIVVTPGALRARS